MRGIVKPLTSEDLRFQRRDRRFVLQIRFRMTSLDKFGELHTDDEWIDVPCVDENGSPFIDSFMGVAR